MDGAGRLDEAEADLVSLGERVGVVPRVRSDEAGAVGVVEGALRGLAALLASEDLVSSELGSAAKGECVCSTRRAQYRSHPSDEHPSLRGGLCARGPYDLRTYLQGLRYERSARSVPRVR